MAHRACKYNTQMTCHDHDNAMRGKTQAVGQLLEPRQGRARARSKALQVSNVDLHSDQKFSKNRSGVSFNRGHDVHMHVRQQPEQLPYAHAGDPPAGGELGAITAAARSD